MRTASHEPRQFTCVACAGQFTKSWSTTKAYHCGPCSKAYRAVQQEAVKALSNARRHGLIKSYVGEPCTDCAKPAQCHDHRDYTKPLDVVAVCNSCNAKRGLAAWRAPNTPA